MKCENVRKKKDEEKGVVWIDKCNFELIDKQKNKKKKQKGIKTD